MAYKLQRYNFQSLPVVRNHFEKALSHMASMIENGPPPAEPGRAEAGKPPSFDQFLYDQSHRVEPREEKKGR